ncbi:MAG: class I SAM-dependent methyltransferase [Desulfovibrio sp.]|uniref:class I SAM-dependent methyltransferase n=1 Tax=Desulfovibrio sp. TaxID=885 RepID=UPI0039E66B5A
MKQSNISPLCLCGSQVSGKGLLASLLNGHPDVLSFSFWHDFMASALCYLSAWKPPMLYHFDEKTEKMCDVRAALSCAGRWNHLEGFARQGYIPFTVSGDNIVKLPFKLDFYALDKALMDRLSTLEHLDAQSVFSEMHSVLGEHLMPEAPRPTWGVSMPQVDFFRFETLLQTYPQAKVVYIMRDTQEVLYAHCKREAFTRQMSIEDALEELTTIKPDWLRRMLKAKDVAARFANQHPDRFMTIKFTDLVCDTATVMPRLAAWIGIEDLPCLYKGTWNGVEIDKRLTGSVLDKSENTPAEFANMTSKDIADIKTKIEQAGTPSETAIVSQAARFEKMGWDYKKALEKTNAILPLLGIAGTFHENMYEGASQHWLALAAIVPEKVRRILEIGTFSGDTTAFLSALFPHAQIVTCDLPDDSQRYITSYGRQNPEKKRALEEQREKNLSAKNITFIQKNSFLLPQYISGTFDIIWMDGGHNYPDVAFDLCNSWHMLADDGILLCDDIFIPQPENTSKNHDSYNVFLPLIRDNIIDVNYMLKRLCVAPSPGLEGKMIAAVKKIPQSSI